MEALELREKLIEQFSVFIQDDSKLLTLDGIFDALNTKNNHSTSVPESHYRIIEERRTKYYAGKTNGLTWEEVKENLKNKYGF